MCFWVLYLRVTMCMVEGRALRGHYNHYPYNFQHFNLNHLLLLVNGKQIPTQAFKPDFTAQRFIDDYDSLYDAFGRYGADFALSFSRDDYRQGYAIWVFDLTPGNCSSGCITPRVEGNVRLELQLAAATTETVQIILCAEYDSSIEIDKFRNVLFHL